MGSGIWCSPVATAIEVVRGNRREYPHCGTKNGSIGAMSISSTATTHFEKPSFGRQGPTRETGPVSSSLAMGKPSVVWYTAGSPYLSSLPSFDRPYFIIGTWPLWSCNAGQSCFPCFAAVFPCSPEEYTGEYRTVFPIDTVLPIGRARRQPAWRWLGRSCGRSNHSLRRPSLPYSRQAEKSLTRFHYLGRLNPRQHVVICGRLQPR